MSDHELYERIAAVESRCKSNTHRVDTLEENVSVIQEIALSVRELAPEMKNMKEEQRDIFSRLNRIEKKPAERFETIIKTALTAIVSAVLGGFLGQFF